MYKKDLDAKIEPKVYKVYKEDQYKAGTSELRLISWVVNGKPMPPRLERRDFFYGTDGSKKTAKCKGLTYEDITFIVDNAREIQNLMVGIKDDTVKEEKQKTMAMDTIPGEMSF